MNYREVKCSERLPKKEGYYVIHDVNNKGIYPTLIQARFNGIKWLIDGDTYSPDIWFEPYSDNKVRELLSKIHDMCFDEHLEADDIYNLESEIASCLSYSEGEEDKWISDSEMLDWLQCIMTKGDDYCEVFFAGLRDVDKNLQFMDATQFQIESNPEKFNTTRGKTIREAIISAMKLLPTAPKINNK